MEINNNSDDEISPYTLNIKYKLFFYFLLNKIYKLCINYYKCGYKVINFDISPLKIDSDNDEIMNWIFEDIEYKYNIKIEIKKN